MPQDKPQRETYMLIIHGYSDCSESFVAIRDYLKKKQANKIGAIYYADYESREDNLTFEDVIEGLNDEMIANQIIKSDGTSVSTRPTAYCCV